ALRNEIETHLEFVHRHRMPDVAAAIECVRWFVERLTGRVTRVDRIPPEHRIESRDLETFVAGPKAWNINRFWYLEKKLHLAVVYGEFDEATRAAEEARPLEWTMPGFMSIADYVLHSAIAYARSGDRGKARACERRLRVWADTCPSSFLD